MTSTISPSSSRVRLLVLPLSKRTTRSSSFFTATLCCCTPTPSHLSLSTALRVSLSLVLLSLLPCALWQFAAALLCLVLATIVTPVAADAGSVANVLGDILAVFIGIAIVFICVCALIGYFARPRG